MEKAQDIDAVFNILWRKGVTFQDVSTIAQLAEKHTELKINQTAAKILGCRENLSKDLFVRFMKNSPNANDLIDLACYSKGTSKLILIDYAKKAILSGELDIKDYKEGFFSGKVVPVYKILLEKAQSKREVCNTLSELGIYTEKIVFSTNLRQILEVILHFPGGY